MTKKCIVIKKTSVFEISWGQYVKSYEKVAKNFKKFSKGLVFCFNSSYTKIRKSIEIRISKFCRIAYANVIYFCTSPSENDLLFHVVSFSQNYTTWNEGKALSSN